MTCTLRARFAALFLLLIPAAAFGQGAVLQSGPRAPGHIPQYVGSGSQTIVMDGGPAAGGSVGVNPSELGVTLRGTGTAPYANAGTGPFGTNICDYDAPITNPTGYHYLCFSPNAQGGGLITYGAGGTATALPFSIVVNGQTFVFPAAGGSLTTYTAPTTTNSFPCWTNTTGLLADCSIGAATIVGNPFGSPGKANAFTLASLPARGAPDPNNDKILIFDNAAGTFKYVTPGLIASAATAGVSSIAGVTGAITLGPNLAMAGSQLNANPGGSSGQVQFNNGGALGGLTNAQLTALVNQFSSSLSGAVPPGGSTPQAFLRFDGTFSPFQTTRVVTAAGAVTVATTDYIVVVNKTVGAATTLNLPACTANLQFVIKDGKGDAYANPIAITPAAGTIDGASSYSLNVGYGAVGVVCNGTQWNVL